MEVLALEERTTGARPRLGGTRSPCAQRNAEAKKKTKATRKCCIGLPRRRVMMMEGRRDRDLSLKQVRVVAIRSHLS